jgi:membrane protease YdiL (CAAX protease family)
MSSFLKIVFVPLAAALIALVITAYGQGLWGLLAIANLRVDPDFPWAAILMAFLLAGLLLYLAGFGPPVHTRTLRRSLLRWNTMPANVFLWALVAGIFGDIALGGIWIATSDLIHIPPGITPSMKGVPLPTAIAFLIMAALAAPLTEEAAFRGYAQGLLERAWGWAPAAIIGSSILFAGVHFIQGLFLPKLGLYFLAGLIFGTIAYLTNSLYVAMIVHSVADFEGFLLLWPHDAHPHRLVTEGGHDPLFTPAVAALVIFGPASLLVFRHLARLTRIA